jgi:hypothetical protein
MNDGENRASEGRTARKIEQQTKRIPSDWFLWAAGASVITSASMFAAGNKRGALFVGQWAPTILLLGTYNKIVKLLGSK